MFGLGGYAPQGVALPAITNDGWSWLGPRRVECNGRPCGGRGRRRRRGDRRRDRFGCSGCRGLLGDRQDRLTCRGYRSFPGDRRWTGRRDCRGRRRRDRDRLCGDRRFCGGDRRCAVAERTRFRELDADVIAQPSIAADRPDRATRDAPLQAARRERAFEDRGDGASGLETLAALGEEPRFREIDQRGFDAVRLEAQAGDLREVGGWTPLRFPVLTAVGRGGCGARSLALGCGCYGRRQGRGRLTLGFVAAWRNGQHYGASLFCAGAAVPSVLASSETGAPRSTATS